VTLAAAVLSHAADAAQSAVPGAVVETVSPFEGDRWYKNH